MLSPARTTLQKEFCHFYFGCISVLYFLFLEGMTIWLFAGGYRKRNRIKGILQVLALYHSIKLRMEFTFNPTVTEAELHRYASGLDYLTTATPGDLLKRVELCITIIGKLLDDMKATLDCVEKVEKWQK